MTRSAKDPGIAVVPTPRTAIFATGMPAANPATDAGVKTATTARPDVFNDPDPPTVTVARGSA